MSAKDVANRLFHFIAGLVITILGIIFIIMEFSSKVTADTNLVWPFVVFFFGIGWIVVAFDKHKKVQQMAQNTTPLTNVENNPPSVQTENNSQPVQTEHTPPPMNMS